MASRRRRLGKGCVMSMPKIAVIGDRDSILGFKAVGVITFPTSGPEEVKDALRKVTGGDYAVVFITEQAADQAREAVEEINARPTPILVPIPSSRGSLGMGRAQIRRSVEKAVGADILFGKEGR